MPLLDHVERGLEFADLLALPAALDYFSVAPRAVISQERQVLTASDASRLARPAVVADQGSEVLREASQPALERFRCQILVAQTYHAASIITLHGVVDAPDVVVGRVVQVAADDLDAKGPHAANLHVRKRRRREGGVLGQPSACGLPGLPDRCARVVAAAGSRATMMYDHEFVRVFWLLSQSPSTERRNGTGP